MASRADITAKLGLDTSGFKNGLKKSKHNIKQFTSSAIKSFGLLAGAAGIGSLTKSAIDLGSKISDMAVQMRIGTDELQTLEFAAREAGVGVEIMARALRNSQLRTQEAINGNKSYAAAFERLGINLQEFNALPTEKKLEAIAIAQRDATDQASAYNDVSRILGEKAGPALQEVLQKLAGPEGYGGLEAAAKRAGEVMSKETIAKMDAAADKIESFKRKLTVLSGEIIAKVMPALQLLGEGLGIIGDAFGSGAIKTGSIKDFMKSIATDPKGIKENYREMWKELRKEDNSFEKGRADRAAKAKLAWADMNGDMVKTSQDAAKEISKSGVGGSGVGGGGSGGGSGASSTKSGDPMGLNIERKEFEARNDFIRRRGKARDAHLTLNEKMRTQAMTGESAGISDSLIQSARGNITAPSGQVAPTAAKDSASLEKIEKSTEIMATALTTTK